MRTVLSFILWTAIALLAAGSFAVMALKRGESVNAAWLVTAALCSYAVGYRFYARFIARRVFALDDARPTPAVRCDDGHDYVPTSKWVVFGHHFAAIAGAGPLVGPILAAQFGFLPGTIWIIVGVVLAGAVQDLVILCASMRRDGKSLAQMAREEVNPIAGGIALLSIIGIILILIAFLALVVVNALAESPWGTVTIGLTIPIALLMGVWMRFIRPGKVLEASAIGVVLLIAALFAGEWVHGHETLKGWFTFGATELAWGVIIYGFIAAALPVWLLLAPRDYLSAFVKVGTVALLAFGVLWVRPELHMPAVTPHFAAGGMWAEGTGPVVPGAIFPFCFIVIACGAISGFHALVASGTTPKMISRETHAPAIAYGGMLMESFVAVLALIAACALHPGIYFAMNAGVLKPIAQDLPKVCETINGWIGAWGFTLTPEMLKHTSEQVHTDIVGRTGGAPTLAVGMAMIFDKAFGGSALAYWYHFAIMFEALFILTTIDAGTRVGRFLMQELAGRVWKPLGRLTWWPAIIVGSLLMVAGWGYFLLAAIADPNGGVRALVPLFGISNQLLAAVALSVATVILIKMGKARAAVITLLPLSWLLVVTETAGWQLLFSAKPNLGLFAGIAKARADLAAGTLSEALASTQIFNKYVCAILCATFMTVIVVIVAISAWECFLLLTGRKPIVTRTSVPAEPGPSEAELREG
ncbi:MAG: carbon starvation protein A [Planctomycetes bacterium]|nr:carbon starvation protein A [Planctomycetota bacterium]